MLELRDLPFVNAVLNSTSTVLLLAGFYFIRSGKRKAVHRRFMVSALITSSLFLLSYIIYHSNVGTIRFAGEGSSRTVYFAILWSHTFLAALLPFLAIITIFRALRERFDRHRAIARWTLPVWLYVSVTGVAIYLMLYQIYPSVP